MILISSVTSLSRAFECKFKSVILEEEQGGIEILYSDFPFVSDITILVDRQRS